MKPKNGTIIFRTPLADCWLDGHILHLILNEEKRTLSNTRQHYAILKETAQHKVLMMVEIGKCQQFEKKVRDLIDKELPLICSALAIVTKETCERNVIRYFLSLEKKGVQVQIFNNEKEAGAWLDSIIKKTTPSVLFSNGKHE